MKNLIIVLLSVLCVYQTVYLDVSLPDMLIIGFGVYYAVSFLRMYRRYG